MSQTRSPLCKKCAFKDACEDYKWLCFWPIWTILLIVVGILAFALIAGID